MRSGFRACVAKPTQLSVGTSPGSGARKASRKGAKAYFVQDFGANAAQPIEELIKTWRLPMQKIIISNYIMEMLRPHAPADELSYVPNSVDLDHFRSEPRGKQQTPTFGMVYS